MVETSLQETKTQLIVSFERTFLEQLLQACHGNIAKAARVTQKNRRALFELIRKHEIDVERYRTAAVSMRDL
jgi:two-component system, NtrC family, response regulator GlrR